MISTRTSLTKDFETLMSLLGESIVSNMKIEDNIIRAANRIIIVMSLIYDSLLPFLLKQALCSSNSCCFELKLAVINVAS